MIIFRFASNNLRKHKVCSEKCLRVRRECLLNVIEKMKQNHINILKKTSDQQHLQQTKHFMNKKFRFFPEKIEIFPKPKIYPKVPQKAEMQDPGRVLRTKLPRICLRLDVESQVLVNIQECWKLRSNSRRVVRLRITEA